MDTTKKYIEMSEKAAKDLGGAYDKPPDPSDVIAMEQTVAKRDFQVISGLQMWRRMAPHDPISSDRLIIKLYKQDELQEMVDKKARKMVAAVKDTTLPYLLTQKFYYAVCGGSVSYGPGFTSIEQLWLAFVMKEKYKKVWNGKDWING